MSPIERNRHYLRKLAHDLWIEKEFETEMMVNAEENQASKITPTETSPEVSILTMHELI
jgi:hypothetical protein